MSIYYCYLLQSVSHPNNTYIGITNDLIRRVKQHNGHLKGGAKATRKHKDWHIVKSVELSDKSKALSFEYWAKHYRTKTGKISRTGPGISNKIKRMTELEQEIKSLPVLS